MNTVEQSTLDQPGSGAAPEQFSNPGAEEPEIVEPEIKINGFDSGTRPIYREPSLYLSILVVFVATYCCLGKTPTIFWLALSVLTGVAIMFHVLAERVLFRARREFDAFAAPLEGIFVLTLGAILPGLALLGYSVFSMVNGQVNFSEFGKVALVLVVPFFNFLVWSAVRKGYLARPRLIGLMNGLTLGLSASWLGIWIHAVFFKSGGPSCKFGWMLLLSTSPFLLFAAFCLSLDLWQKTNASMRRITGTFSIMGIVLSMLFVLAPVGRVSYIQSLITAARHSSGDDLAQAVGALRTSASDEDLRPSKSTVSGFALAEMLVPNRGLEDGSDIDKDLFFRITGKPYVSEPGGLPWQSHPELWNPLIGMKVPGLSLSKSQMSGLIDSETLSASVDWTMTFHNSSAASQEARGEITVPEGAAVSRVTLWVNGQPQEGAFAAKSQAQEAYQSTVEQRRDPLLVTMNSPGRILVQCFPVPANGGEMRIRIGFKVPLATSDGKTCTMDLPRMADGNFVQLKRHRVSFSSDRKVVGQASAAGLSSAVGEHGYALSGILRTSELGKRMPRLSVVRNSAFKNVAVQDWYSRKPGYIVETLREVKISTPSRLFVVLDTSASLKTQASQIRQALAGLPASLKPMVYLVKDDFTAAVVNTSNDAFAPAPVPSTTDVNETSSAPVQPVSLKQAEEMVTEELFAGGKDNIACLREVLETASERAGSAVLWIHGPQPQSRKMSESVLEMINRVKLYDLEVVAGANNVLPTIQSDDVSHLVSCETVKSGLSSSQLKDLLAGMKNGKTATVIERTRMEGKPAIPVIADAGAAARLTCLWASDEVTRRLESGPYNAAQSLAVQYRLVTPASGAVVLENARDYAAKGLNPGAYVDAPDHSPPPAISATIAPVQTFGGLAGAPVDPRYGQSNEVGMLADYGYDTARDISRALTLIALLISTAVAIGFLRGRRPMTFGAVTKAIGIALVAPLAVHVVGTFLINNFGGLGSGL